jgi:type I restriction enzyme, S subunit
MKADWEVKIFEDCIEKVVYTTKIQRKDFLESGLYPIISQEENFINGYWNNESDIFIIKNPVVIFGDHTKVLKYVDFDFVLGADGVKILQPQFFLFPRFFYYQLQSINLDSLGYARHYKLLKELDIKYPPLPEQQRIVALLDAAFASIATAKANTEQNLKNARALFDSYLHEVFSKRGEGWSFKKLNEVCELKSGTTISISLERSFGDVLYTKIADMNLPENTVEIHTSSRFVNSNEIKQNQIIPEGAIIFPKRGGAIATNKKRKIIKPTIVDLNTMAIIPSNKINKDYFYHWFQLFDLNSISNGANIPQINNYSFDDVYIPYPNSLEEQRILVKKLDDLKKETQRLETLYQRKLQALDELKKSLLHKAFSGLL